FLQKTYLLLCFFNIFHGKAYFFFHHFNPTSTKLIFFHFFLKKSITSIQLAVVPFSFSYLSSSYTKLMLCCIITKIRLEYMQQNDLINELAFNCKKRK
ncbi:hypothetical protein ES332_A13G073400v1, partial [Gossypium tomentosum]